VSVGTHGTRYGHLVNSSVLLGENIDAHIASVDVTAFHEHGA
jgi:hypothetical protein